MESQRGGIVRSTRNQPFCWQEKIILRAIRKKYNKSENAKLRNLYLTITELDSDFNGKDIKYYTKTISKYSGLSVDWIPQGLKVFQDMGIIQMTEERLKGKYKGKLLTFTPENLKETPQKTVTGKTGTGKSVNGKNDTSEDILLLEDIPLLEELSHQPGNEPNKNVSKINDVFPNQQKEQITKTKELQKEKKSLETEKEKKKGGVRKIKKQDLIDVYKIYPTHCFNGGGCTSRSNFEDAKLKKLIEAYGKEEVVNIIRLYLEDCKKSRRYLKNFKTLVNNFPRREDFGVVKKETKKTELTEEQKKNLKKTFEQGFIGNPG